MRVALQKKREKKKNETKMSGDKERESVANISRTYLMAVAESLKARTSSLHMSVLLYFSLMEKPMWRKLKSSTNIWTNHKTVLQSHLQSCQ